MEFHVKLPDPANSSTRAVDASEQAANTRHLLTPLTDDGIVVRRAVAERVRRFIGPALAHRLLLHFGSVERIITADETTLMQIPGIGPKKASRIRELVR